MERSPPSAIGLALVAITVMGAGVALRLPSCYESFWIDELHSAWAVWGELGDVVPRARIGHQSPFYFIGLWFWKQLVGDSEVALRLSSVLAVSVASVVVAIGTARWSKSLLGGFVAGLALATESNSLFFGTELRPYAFVILFSAVAVVGFLRLLGTSSRDEDRASWLTINVAILLAIMCQPTALGVLAWLPLTLIAIWFKRDRGKLLRFSLVDAFILIGISAVGFAVWSFTLNETWNQRQNWVTFASASELAQIWQVWDWEWLLLSPLVVLVVAQCLSLYRGRGPVTRHWFYASIMLAMLTVLGTVMYWVLSWSNVAPIWHRRYFIALLPFFACFSGGAISVLDSALLPYRRSGFTAIIATIAMAIVLPYQQGTLSRLHRYPVALVVRGEDWRGAIQWVRANIEPNDFVFMDAGLIENRAWLRGSSNPAGTVQVGPVHMLTKEQREYLAYAVSGPYPIDRRVIVFSRSGVNVWWKKSESPSRRMFTIVRMPPGRVNGSLPAGSHVLDFGNVTVIFQASKLDLTF